MTVEARTHRGWKEIAKRLGCCIRTAKRQVKEYSIPVIRFRGRVQLDEGIYQQYLRELKDRADKNGQFKSNLPKLKDLS